MRLSYINQERNTLIKKTIHNSKDDYTSFEEKIYLWIKWKLNEIVSPKQVFWDYNYLSDKNEIELNWKKDIDIWIDKEIENIKNTIINNSKNILKYLTWLWYTNYSDQIPSKAEKIIFAYAMKSWIYSGEEINSIKFNHWENKDFYIEKYCKNITTQEELLYELKELWKENTERIKKIHEKNPIKWWKMNFIIDECFDSN